MTVTVTVPDELAARLQAAARARGVTVEQLAVEVLEEHTAVAVTTTGADGPVRRRLALAGIGASGSGLTHRIDEWLADGFGRD